MLHSALVHIYLHITHRYLHCCIRCVVSYLCRFFMNDKYKGFEELNKWDLVKRRIINNKQSLQYYKLLKRYKIRYIKPLKQ